VRILLLNGPNLAILGRRQPELYGQRTLAEIVDACRARAIERGATLDHLQSNHEGALIDRLEQLDYDAVVINPGALAHTSYALHDALLASGRSAVEVHISDTAARETWRRTSVTAPATRHQVIGAGWRGYLEAIDWLLDTDRAAARPAPADR
jgi:3-dehydroquinate dehydratase II